MNIIIRPSNSSLLTLKSLPTAPRGHLEMIKTGRLKSPPAEPNIELLFVLHVRVACRSVADWLAVVSLTGTRHVGRPTKVN